MTSFFVIDKGARGSGRVAQQCGLVRRDSSSRRACVSSASGFVG